MRDIRGFDLAEGDTIAMAASFSSSGLGLMLARVSAVTPMGVYAVGFQKGSTPIHGVGMAIPNDRPVVVVCRAPLPTAVKVKAGVDQYDDDIPWAANN